MNYHKINNYFFSIYHIIDLIWAKSMFQTIYNRILLRKHT